MQYLINGAQFDFTTVRGPAVPITSITNANPAVANTATPPQADSIVVVESGWAGINGRPANVANPTANSFALAGFDTTDTTRYLPSLSAGSYRVMSGFTAMDQITGIELTGGDPNSTEWVYVEDPTGQSQSMNTNKNPLVMTFTQHYDPDKPWFNALIAVDEAKLPIVVRERLPSGRVNLFAGSMAFQQFPTRTPNEIQVVTVTLRINKFSVYPAPVSGS